MFHFINLYKYSYPFFKNIAFALDAEAAHEATLWAMKRFGPFMPNSHTPNELSLNVAGMHFQNPFGLAAGLDKNAEGVSFLSHLPFSFIEVGTVTPKPQSGNERPRLFRYIDEESLRNRMGFNNLGMEEVLKNIANGNRRGKILGVNLGKNKATPNEEAHLDYAALYEKFAAVSDYLVINVSSPNTPGLRDLLSDEGLRLIFSTLTPYREKCPKPLFVKVSPDMQKDQLASVVHLACQYKLAGIIATNTTIMESRGEGGISGKLLYQKSKAAREFLLSEIKRTNAPLELIGVGGFSQFSDVLDFWKCGGKLVQLYTAFIFQGPSLLYQFEAELLREMKKSKSTQFESFLLTLRS